MYLDNCYTYKGGVFYGSQILGLLFESLNDSALYDSLEHKTKAADLCSAASVS